MVASDVPIAVRLHVADDRVPGARSAPTVLSPDSPRRKTQSGAVCVQEQGESMAFDNGFIRIAFLLVLNGPVLPAQRATQPIGSPISDLLVIRKCRGCHQRDANGMMTPIYE